MEKTYRLKGLDCPNCSKKIENAVNGLPDVRHATVDFMTTKMTLEADQADFQQAEANAKMIIQKLEPDVSVIPENGESEAHGHDHDHGDVDNKTLIRIVIALVALVLLFVMKPQGLIRLIAYLAVYLLIGGDIVKKAFTNILHGEVFDENFLMSVATIGAMAIGEYPEAVAVMLFYQIGEFFQDYAVSRSRKSITELMDIRPDYANIEVDGKLQQVKPETLKKEDIIFVKPGEKVPLDGIILDGQSMVDTSALTGESVPRRVIVGDDVLSGFVNQKGLLKVKVEKPFGESTVSKILDLVENASSKKAPAENFITKFARYYTPIVVGLAALLAILPPLVLQQPFQEWVYRALTFLVISCPCALVISVPLSFFGGIGGASRRGILIKGGNYIESLAQLDTVVFDKTGTLTEGSFAVQKVETSMDEQEFLKIAASAEQVSDHPIAQSIMKAYDGELLPLENVEEIAGKGIQAVIGGQQVLIGNHKLFTDIQIERTDEIGTLIYLAVDGKYQGRIVIADKIKEDTVQALKELKNLGIEKTVMLTGDNQKIADAIASKLGIRQVYSDLLPEDKVTKLEAIMKNNQKVAFVGDGMNDAPVLARANIGIAMGGLGSDAAIEAADVVIMDDRPAKIPLAIKISRKTMKIVHQNIVFAIAIKIIVLLLGALGFASMAAAVFADVGVTVLAVLNAMRALRTK